MIRQKYRQKESIPVTKATQKSNPIRVVTIDDSALIRLTLNRYLNQFPDIDVIGQASNGQEMLALVGNVLPDVVVLDVEMPVMNGLEALERLMRAQPTPVIMLSNLTWSGAEVTLQALELGAVDFVVKPQPGVTMAATVDLLAEKIRQAATANIQVPRLNQSTKPEQSGLDQQESGVDRNRGKQTGSLLSQESLLAVASSTGGPSALTAFLSALPAGLPVGGVIVQHMPVGFTTILGQRLNKIGGYKVTEAITGSRLMRGQFLIAPGGYHLTFDSQGCAVLNEEPAVNGVRPAADVTFSSLAEHFGPQITAVVMTGMGNDGFAGAMEIHQQGGRILAQDEQSAVVFGMPRRIVESNLAEYVASPELLAAYVAKQVTA